jgi:RNA polymerase sigma-70 factor (ECF subfamily)
VRDAVNGLPLDQRQALTLAYLDGHSHSQVADLLHIPIGTVKSRIRRGLQRLKPALVPDLGVI